MGGARTRAVENTGDSDRIGAARNIVSVMAGPRAAVAATATEPGECNAS